MSKCESCRHFRPVERGRAPAQALRWLTRSPRSAKTFEEFARIANVERGLWEIETKMATAHKLDVLGKMKARGLEFTETGPSDEAKAAFNQYIRPLLSRGPFNEEPRTIAHCNADGDRGSYHIPEVRNWADSCTAFSPRDQTPDCSACRFYRKNDGERRMLATARGLIQTIHQVDSSGASFLQSRVEEIHGVIDPAKAQELGEAYNADGRLETPLEYLPTCTVRCERCAKQVEPTPGCVTCRLCQPEIFNRFLACTAGEPAVTSTAGEDPGEAPLRNAPRRTALDALGIGGRFDADRRRW